ncbi:MAG: tetratricopeptide repeat protein [Desulfovibrionaceae bacterium]|nr:tetratricopeptide repeat protein [Desulfovibrionaceae bacterium]
MSKHIDYEINRELGECYLFMGEMDKAAEYYQKAVDCGTGHTEPFFGLAAVAIQKGELKEAGRHYLAALELAPSDKALVGLGLVFMEEGADDEAFIHMDKALELNAANIMALNALIRLAYKLSRVDEIIPRLSAALDGEDNESVRFTLAGCLSYLGRNDAAMEELKILLGKNPGHTDAQELYAHIAA